MFSAYGVWLPVVAPLLLQLPLALAGALLGHYLYKLRSSSRLHKTLAVYLPRGAVTQLSEPAAQATKIGRTMFGVCLATDIARYSALSEGLAPDALRALLNLYFERLFEPVRRHGGEVCDIKGDAMLAIWTGGRPAVLRAAACRAALDIFHAVDGFGRDLQGARLPTRIGLHCGRIEWSFPWASSFGSDFNYDFGVGFTEEQQRNGSIEYNYRREAASQVRGGEEPEIPSRSTPDGATTFAAMSGTDAATYTR